MKPPKFDGVKEPIVAMRWLCDVEVCFFTCSFADDQKVECALNLLQLGLDTHSKLRTANSQEVQALDTHSKGHKIYDYYLG